LNYIIVDIETTGGTPKTSKITEIAMYKTNGKEIIDEYSSLVNPERKIDEFVVRLTGITDKMVSTAPKFYEIAKDILNFAEGCTFVAHNVSFDYGIIRSEFRSLGFDLRMPHLCTVRASKFILPGYNSYSLSKLSADLGIVMKAKHRASDDALATTYIFHMLIEKGVENLLKFVQNDINPKILHPNLDLEFLETIPDKTGIYKFFNETNQLIYIGKSKHIKKRVNQHLKNNATLRGVEMQKEIHHIEFELTGSELIALLFESQLVKKHKPIYNRQLRKELFPYGIFSFTNDMGYLQLFIERCSKKTEVPYASFSSKAEATSYLTHQCETRILCQKYCNLYQTRTSCFAFEVKQCFGACIEKEKAENYNKRVELLIQDLKFEYENFIILEKGAERNEKSAILVENGIYKGYGKIPSYAIKKGPNMWKKHIDFYQEDKDARTIISSYIRKNPDLNIVVLD
jgi:DNA polymerase-3 subunit epsilon